MLFAVLCGEILKYVIGRSRPFVGGEANAFYFHHFAGNPAFESLPSGHATTAFALAFAVSAVWRKATLIMFVYAVLICISRVILLAHHPSDVVGGALMGVIAAMFVRYWFASRRLAFTIGRDGAIQPLAAPSWTSLKRVAREAFDTIRSGRPARLFSRIYGLLDPNRHMSDQPANSGLPAPDVSIVVPVRNEQDNVAPLIAEIAAALDGRWAYEIIYINDGSTDATGERLATEMRARSNLRQIRHAASSGQSAAVRTGVRAARGKIVATLDGDGQNNPAFLPALIEAIEKGGDKVGLAAGQRVGRKDTGFKKFQSRTANAVRNAILRDGTRDTGCGLKALRRDVFLALPYFDGLHRFLPALVRREGLRHCLCRRDRPPAPFRRLKLRLL